MKNTKTKLISSVTVLLICFAMLIGSTFAWFTDSASTGVNKIQAGNLDVQLLAEDGSSLDGQPLTWKKAAQGASEEVLWEPGCTYDLQPVVIKNNGNLALKYKVVITGINGSAKLNEVIDWTIKADDADFNFNDYHSLGVSASNKLTISGHMKDTANNDYQNLSIDGIGITVVATQDKVEYDSNGNNYDASANEFSVWDGTVDSEGLANNTDNDTRTVAIKSAAQFAAFEKSVNEGRNSYSGYTINLLTPIDLNNRDWTPIGQTGNATFSGTFDGHGLTIKNLSIQDSATNWDHGTGIFGWTTDATIKNVNVIGANISGHSYAGVIVGYVESVNKSYILNCKVDNANVSSTCMSIENNDGLGEGAKAGGIVGFGANEKTLIKDCIVSESSISAGRDAGQVVGFARLSNVDNCSATRVTVTANGSSTGANINESIIGRVQP